MTGATVDCGLCSKPTTKTGTRRCDRCYELETRILADPALARRVLDAIEKDVPFCLHGAAPEDCPLCFPDWPVDVEKVYVAGDLRVTPHKVDEHGQLIEAEIEGHGLFRHLVTPETGPTTWTPGLINPDYRCYDAKALAVNENGILSERLPASVYSLAKLEALTRRELGRLHVRLRKLESPEGEDDG